MAKGLKESQRQKSIFVAVMQQIEISPGYWGQTLSGGHRPCHPRLGPIHEASVGSAHPRNQQASQG